MKFLVLALSLIAASTAAHAVTLHQCVINVTSKADASTSKKIAYVANATGNTVRVSGLTVLGISLPLVGLNASVSVNGQPNFIFQGSLAHGQFESAFDRGTIACDAGQEVGAVYSSSGVTHPASQGSMLASCYLGSASAVAADLVSVNGFTGKSISVDARTGAVSASRVENQCLVGHGTNADDYVCTNRGNVKATYTISNCNYSGEQQ